jgi:hypothetical protein
LYMTKYFWIILAALLIYETVTFANKKKGDTISEQVWKLSLNRPLVPFLLGMVCGHFFWQQTPIETLLKPE